MQVVMAYAVYHWKRALREPLTLGWTFALPVLLLMMFGGIAASGVHASGCAEGFRQAQTADRYATFLTLGLIGLNTASVGIFGLGLVLVQARELRILQRLALTPQPAWRFVAGHLLATSVLVGLSTLLLLAVGVCVFGIPLPRRPLAWGSILGLGTLTFLTLGYALAAMIDNVRTAQILGNTIFLLLLCLGGVWVPLTIFPIPLRWVGSVLPLAPFLAALRGIGGLGQPLGMYWPTCALLAAWSIAAAGVAVRQFRFSAAQDA
jgi:ABC-2 type transport system permease protein